MKNILKLVNRYIGIIIFVICVFTWLISYYKVPLLYFQQDEIMGFGLFLKEGSSIILRGIGSKNIQHFVPVSMAISYFLFKYVGFNYFIYNSFGLFFHTLNGILLYILSKKIFKNTNWAVIATIVFFSSFIGSEFVMWPVININTISLSFTLVALILLFDNYFIYKINISNFCRGIIFSTLFLLSVFSIEYSIALSLLIPFSLFILYNDLNIKKIFGIVIPFLLTVFAYFLLRFLPFFYNLKNNDGLNSGIRKIPFIKIISLPFRYISQLFMGDKFIINISDFFRKIFFPNNNEYFSEKYIFPYISFILGLILILLVLFFLKKIKEKDIFSFKVALIFFIYILLSSLPYLFIPGEGSNFSIFSSRYLYFATISSALLITLLMRFLYLNKSNRYFSIFSILFSVSIFYGCYQNNVKLEKLYIVGETRRNIINFIKFKYPVLQNQTIFYTESNMPYYGLEENIMPFQSGFGHTLMIFYSSENKLPIEFYPGLYLWDIKSQDYKGYANNGFGYFRDKNLLKAAITKYNLPRESLIAFSWDGKNQILEDITEKLRDEIFK